MVRNDDGLRHVPRARPGDPRCRLPGCDELHAVQQARIDPYVTSVQWSRRFGGLRLFLSLAAAGWEGHAAHVERAIDHAALLGSMLRARGWRVVNASPLAVLCVVPPAGAADPATIVRRVLASGQAWISTTEFEGRTVIRACITHGATDVTDLETLVAAMEEAR